MDRFRRKLFKSRRNKRSKDSPEPENIDLVTARQYDFDRRQVKEASDAEDENREPYKVLRRTSDGELFCQLRQSKHRVTGGDGLSTLSLNTDRPKTVYEMDGRHVDDAWCGRDAPRKGVVQGPVGSKVCQGSRGSLDGAVLDKRRSARKISKESQCSFGSSASCGGSLDRRYVQIYVDGILRGDSVEQHGDTELENEGDGRRKDEDDADDADDDADASSIHTDKDETSGGEDSDATPTDAKSSDVTPTRSSDSLFVGDLVGFATLSWRRRRLYHSNRSSRFRRRLGTKCALVIPIPGIPVMPYSNSKYSSVFPPGHSKHSNNLHISVPVIPVIPTFPFQ
ncbi:uncharacterized protein [Panulirus ornatus]|uniref:uncharacterized protein n=1 Tax=Panulirus ornatus TaxID=150431 RepID=UPI003A83C4DE